jgi:hypothetical protein
MTELFRNQLSPGDIIIFPASRTSLTVAVIETINHKTSENLPFYYETSRCWTCVRNSGRWALSRKTLRVIDVKKIDFGEFLFSEAFDEGFKKLMTQTREKILKGEKINYV